VFLKRLYSYYIVDEGGICDLMDLMGREGMQVRAKPLFK
jgi:hypothetical protein